MIALLLFVIAMSSPTTGRLRIEHPFRVEAPPQVVSRWESFEELQPGPVGAPVRILAPVEVQKNPGRVDVLRRQGKSWIWSSAYVYVPTLSLSSTDFDRGVLLRFESSPFFLWGEIPAYSTQAVTLTALKRLTIRGADPAARLVLYSSAEAKPRTAAAFENAFEFVPVAPALVCAVSTTASQCVEAAERDTEIVLAARSGDMVRVLRVRAQAEDRLDVLTPGQTAVRPKRVATTLGHASPWVSIAIEDARISWDRVVIDRSGAEFAQERLEGSSLLPPPEFSEINSNEDHGVLVHPWVGSRIHPLSDPSALLLVFPNPDSAVSSRVPLIMASPDPMGDFNLPGLGSGDYVLKLLSSVALSRPVRISAVSGVPLDVVFPSGPVVSGRIVRGSGGTPTDPVIVEVTLATTFQNALQAGDIIDKIHVAEADDNGNFKIVLGASGQYRLRARWGVAIGERDFSIDKALSDVSVGEIVLVRGATLRGYISHCAAGEAALIPLPTDLKLTSGVGEVRRAPIDPQGRFTIEGLSAGRRSVFVKCGEAPIPVSPEIVIVPSDGEIVIEFVRGPESPTK